MEDIKVGDHVVQVRREKRRKERQDVWEAREAKIQNQRWADLAELREIYGR